MLCHVVAKFWAERCALDRQAGFGNGGVSDGMGRRTDGLSNALSMPSAATAGHGNQNLNRSRRLAARKPPRSRRNERQQGVTGVVNTMLRNLRAGLGLAVVLAAVGGVSGSAQAQISDQAVQWYIQFVWNNLGTQFSDRDGTVIKIDKAKKDEIIVPLETAREVIVATLAQIYATSGDDERSRTCVQTSFLLSDVQRPRPALPKAEFPQKRYLTWNRTSRGAWK